MVGGNCPRSRLALGGATAGGGSASMAGCGEEEMLAALLVLSMTLYGR